MKTLMTMALAACAALVGAAEPQPGKIDFNVRDYGGSVAKAAAAAAQAGGGRIVVPPGVWKSGTIWLKDHCELHLERGATILGSERAANYCWGLSPYDFHASETEQHHALYCAVRRFRRAG